MPPTNDGIEAFLDACEDAHRDSLAAQVKRAECEFAQGRAIPWSEVKRPNGL